MQKKIYLFTIIFISMIQLVYGADSTFSVGEKVCVSDEYGEWFEGTITEIIDNSSMVKVKYSNYDNCFLCDDFEFNKDDYNDSLIENWFDTKGGTFRLPYSPETGEEVLIEAEVNFSTTYYYTGKISNKYDNDYFSKYIVKFNNYTSNNTDTDTEDILACRIFKLPEPGDYVWANDLYGKLEKRTDTDSWKVTTGGYTSTDMWIEKENEVGPASFKPAVGDELEDIKYNFDIHKPAELPNNQEIFEFNAKNYPYSIDDSNIPSDFYPISFGGINYGYDEFWLELAWPEFDYPVDVYLIIVYESLDGYSAILSVWSDKSFHSIDEGINPLKSNTTFHKTTLWYNYPSKPLQYSLFPDGRYTFYLFVTPVGDISKFYGWKTYLKKNWPGEYSNEIHNCSTDLSDDINSIISEIETQEASDVYNDLKDYVENYTSSSDEDSTLEAYNNIMFASYFYDNVYPYCWAALKAFEYDNTKTTVMNSAAVCLMELEKQELAAKILDCAYQKDPDFSVTHQNAAFFYKMENKLDKVIDEKINSVELEPENYHNAWDGGYFVDINKNSLSKFSSIDNYFYEKVASNYPLLSHDGAPGKAAPKTIVCCNCNGNIYDDVMECVDNCEVTLACFTHICTPRLECCNGSSPFDFNGGICYPPAGAQLCIGVDAKGNISITGGMGGLSGLIGGKVGIKLNFSGNYTVFAKASLGAGSVSTVLMTTDPKTEQWASSFSLNSGTKFDSGLTLGSNLNIPTSWKKSIWCEFVSN